MWEAKGGGEPNKPAVGHATGAELVHTGAQKTVGALYAGWLGDTEGTSGEPTLGGTPGDPTSGWGVNGIVAGATNLGEILLMLFGVEAKGYVGAVLDGGLEGLANSSLFIFVFKFMNAYAIGKKSGQPGGAVAGFDYEKRRAQLRERQQRMQPQNGRNVVVERAVKQAQNDPYAGYR